MELSPNFGAKVWWGFHPFLLSFLKVSQTLLDFFHCVSPYLPLKTMDLVIINIPNNLPIPCVFDPTFSIPSWNQSVDNFINIIILLSNKLLFENGVVLLFHVDDLCMLKEIWSFLEKYFLKIWMKWIVINNL
jgi:hypothetical protein